jgi:hypothetical protein
LEEADHGSGHTRPSVRYKLSKTLKVIIVFIPALRSPIAIGFQKKNKSKLLELDGNQL